MNPLQLFAGSYSQTIGSAIAEKLNQPLGDIYLHQFPSGERFCQFKENIRGGDVFLIQSIAKPANEALMELLVMADAARRASAERITAVIPYMGYSRQDRKDKSRVPISAKLLLDLLAASGFNRVMTMDLHTPQIAGFTNLPFDHLYFESMLSNLIKQQYDFKTRTDELVVVAPDVGAVKRAEQYANRLGSDFAFLSKKRKSDTIVQVQNFVGNVKDKIVLIVDDVTESFGTLAQAAEKCKEEGARQVIVAVSHLCLTDVGITRLIECDKAKLVDTFIASNSVDNKRTLNLLTNYVELNVGSLFGEAIRCTHENKSITKLFE